MELEKEPYRSKAALFFIRKENLMATSRNETVEGVWWLRPLPGSNRNKMRMKISRTIRGRRSLGLRPRPLPLLSNNQRLRWKGERRKEQSNKPSQLLLHLLLPTNRDKGLSNLHHLPPPRLTLGGTRTRLCPLPSLLTTRPDLRNFS